MLERLLVALEMPSLRDRIIVIVVDNVLRGYRCSETTRAMSPSTEQPGIPYAKQRGLEEVETPFVLSIDADCLPEGLGLGRSADTRG